MALVTAVYKSSNFVILKFYPNIYFSDTAACKGLHLYDLFPLCDVLNTGVCELLTYLQR